MNISKWIMKQYWRVGTIRALLGLALGTLVLGKAFYEYIPPIAGWGFYGAIFLGTILFLLFLFIGWIYDEMAMLWKEGIIIQMDRYPFAFVPEWRMKAIEFPFIFSLLTVLRSILKRTGHNTDRIDALILYLDGFFQGGAGDKDALFGNEKRAQEFISKYPFGEKRLESPQKKTSIAVRVKLAFQLWILRLNYIQSLTGLGQDVLVFAAFYIVIVFPEAPNAESVSIEILLQGILFMSLPLFMVILVAGWVYDRRLKLWSPEQAVIVERNPYSYVPEPRTYALTFPFFFVLLSTLREVIVRKGGDETGFHRQIEFLESFMNLDVSNQEDIEKAQYLRNELGDVFVRPEGSD